MAELYTGNMGARDARELLLSKMVRKTHYLCSEAVLYISSGKGIKASSTVWKTGETG